MKLSVWQLILFFSLATIITATAPENRVEDTFINPTDALTKQNYNQNPPLDDNAWQKLHHFLGNIDSNANLSFLMPAEMATQMTASEFEFKQYTCKVNLSPICTEFDVECRYTANIDEIGASTTFPCRQDDPFASKICQIAEENSQVLKQGCLSTKSISSMNGDSEEIFKLLKQLLEYN